MPDPELILQIMEEQGLDLDEAKEVAEFMEEHEIDEPDIGVEIYENR